VRQRHPVRIPEWVVSVGSLSASIVHPRDVFKPAVIASVAGVVIAHNHPSGDLEPGPEDLAIAKRLVNAEERLGIEIHDHIVFTERSFVSLRERGAL